MILVGPGISLLALLVVAAIYFATARRWGRTIALALASLAVVAAVVWLVMDNNRVLQRVNSGVRIIKR